MENIFRIIGYVILFAVNAALYFFLHSHFHFVVLVLMISAPVLSICFALILRRYISAEISAGALINKKTKGNKKNSRNEILSPQLERYGDQFDEAFFCLNIKNPTWFVSLDLKVDLVIRNTFFGTEGERRISIPVYAGSGYQISIPVIATLPGIVQMEVKSLRIKDLMGFLFLKKKVSSTAEVVIMPELISDLEYDKTDMQQGMLESEESSKRGNDFSDVQEIREYIPGDKLMSIHWKLSAKRDILMVKDRVSMSDRQLVVLPELCNADVKALEIILSTTYSVIHHMIADKTTVRLLYWSVNRYEYEDIRIDYDEELKDAFAKMFYESTYPDMNEAASHMASVHPEMKAYLHITAENGEASIKVREN